MFILDFVCCDIIYDCFIVFVFIEIGYLVYNVIVVKSIFFLLVLLMGLFFVFLLYCDCFFFVDFILWFLLDMFLDF